MELNDLINIRKQNIEEIIKDVIKEARLELNDLTTEQTCFIWSSFIYDALLLRNVNVQFHSTENIPDSYVHFFCSIPSNSSYYVVDLTFNQFNSESFNQLKKDGYQLLSEDEQREYLKIITKKKNNNCSFDDLLFNQLLRC